MLSTDYVITGIGIKWVRVRWIEQVCEEAEEQMHRFCASRMGQDLRQNRDYLPTTFEGKPTQHETSRLIRHLESHNCFFVHEGSRG
jgi:hypothetical protein